VRIFDQAVEGFAADYGAANRFRYRTGLPA
jgi:hypothetical protein